MDAVWALLFATAAVIVVTYWRLPPEELYNVSEEGLASGLGRALVFLNYPVSLVAIPAAWLAADRLGTRRALWAAAAATVLCGVTALPGDTSPPFMRYDFAVGCAVVRADPARLARLAPEGICQKYQLSRR